MIIPNIWHIWENIKWQPNHQPDCLNMEGALGNPGEPSGSSKSNAKKSSARGKGTMKPSLLRPEFVPFQGRNGDGGSSTKITMSHAWFHQMSSNFGVETLQTPVVLLCFVDFAGFRKRRDWETCCHSVENTGASHWCGGSMKIKQWTKSHRAAYNLLNGALQITINYYSPLPNGISGGGKLRRLGKPAGAS